MNWALTLNGVPCAKVRLCIPGTGVWSADVDLSDEKTATGRVTLQIGTTACVGTVDPNHSGDYQGKRRVRLVSGAGGWAKTVLAGKMHNDAGVKAQTVITSIASEIGETLSTTWGGPDRLGNDWIWEQGEASRAMAAVCGATPWYVGLDGVTRVGARPARAPLPADYEVLDYDPRTRTVELAVDDLTKIGVGDTISERLPTPLVITALDFVALPDSIRAYAWCAPAGGQVTALADALSSIAAHVAKRQLFGKYRYRVVQMVSDRVTLQATRKLEGVPDLTAIDMWPGVAGGHAELAPGAEVLVEFEAGDRSLPMITAFAGRERPGHAPTHLDLGGTAGAAAARQGDAVEVLLPPAVFSGTIGGAPASGVITFPLAKTLGTITGGSSKVGIAT